MTPENPVSSSTAFRVEQIDHVEVYVPDIYEAAEWYREVLGLHIIEEYRDWVQGGRGPLMISSDGGNTMVALFSGEPQGEHPVHGVRRVAFRVSGAAFLDFLEAVPGKVIYGLDGKRTDRLEAVDHERAWSAYFCDPYGNLLEITTYDYEVVCDAAV